MHARELQVTGKYFLVRPIRGGTVGGDGGEPLDYPQEVALERLELRLDLLLALLFVCQAYRGGRIFLRLQSLLQLLQLAILFLKKSHIGR